MDTTADDLAVNGNCSLREAIIAANTDAVVDGCAAGSGADEIVFSVDGTFLLTIAGTNENAAATGDLDITAPLTITGAGITDTVINGNDRDRVFHVLNDVDANFSLLTIRDGGGGDVRGAGLVNDGDGTVTITDCAVLSNEGSYGAGLNNSGAGINNPKGGSMHITRCTIDGNVSSGFGGGISNHSVGGIMTLTDSVVTGNSSTDDRGGGVNNNDSGSKLTITRTTISGNWAKEEGGGVHNNSGGTTNIVDSTISGNWTTGATSDGGGLENNHSGTVTVVNSTISGNTAMDTGGGVSNSSSGTIELIHVTVAFNDAPTGGGIFANDSGTLTLTNTIVADNLTGGDCLVEGAAMTSGGNNIDSDDSCGLVASSDQPSVNPQLGPLADNGGPTETHLIDASSPAFNKADRATCELADQRGVSRPSAGGCDVGAVEVDFPPITSNVVVTPNPVAVNTTFDITATVDDTTTGNSDIASAAYTIDGVGSEAMDAQDGTFDSPDEDVTATFDGGLLEAGVYEVCVSGSDNGVTSGAEECTMLAVYDPSAGFVTGGGWINSPAGAYQPDPSLSGKANFGFVSKYKKGANVPDGNTQFVFQAGGMNFQSSSYQWLVVTGGGKAQFKGVGTINGGGNFGFMISATDAESTSNSTDVDSFRIQIWDQDDADALIYDNGAEQALGGGSIVVHTGGKKK